MLDTKAYLVSKTQTVVFLPFLNSYFGVVIIEGLWKPCQGHWDQKKRQKEHEVLRKILVIASCVRELENGITLRTVVGIRLDDAAMLSLASSTAFFFSALAATEESFQTTWWSSSSYKEMMVFVVRGWQHNHYDSTPLCAFSIRLLV